MECLYRGYNVSSWRFIWLNMKIKWKPSFHEFDEALSIPTSIFLTGHLLTHGCIVSHANSKIGLQRNSNISKMVTNLGKRHLESLTGLIWNKAHVFVFARFTFIFLENAFEVDWSKPLRFSLDLMLEVHTCDLGGI